MNARLVVCGRRTAQGGTERVADYQARALEQRGWNVEWVTPEMISRPVRSKRFPGLNLAFDVLALGRLIRKMPRADITLSHGALGIGPRGTRIHTYHGTFAGLAAACQAGLPALDRAVMRWINGGLETSSGRGATAVAVSVQAEREVRQHYQVRCHSVVHNGVATDHFAPTCNRAEARRRWKLPEDRYLALVVGRMDYGKGREVLRRLIPQLPEQMVVVLAAPSWSGLQTLPAERFIHIPGVVYADLPALYGACDVCLCPSLYEGFGLTAVEAWSCELPVVSGRTGMLRELEGKEPTLDLCLANCGDADALASALIRLWQEPEIARAQAAWGRRLVVEQFGVERMAARYLELVQLALGSSIRSPAGGVVAP